MFSGHFPKKLSDLFMIFSRTWRKAESWSRSVIKMFLYGSLGSHEKDSSSDGIGFKTYSLMPSIILFPYVTKIVFLFNRLHNETYSSSSCRIDFRQKLYDIFMLEFLFFFLSRFNGGFEWIEHLPITSEKRTDVFSLFLQDGFAPFSKMKKII